MRPQEKQTLLAKAKIICLFFSSRISKSNNRLYLGFIAIIFVILYLFAMQSSGNSNVQYYVSWAREIFHHQLFASYHIVNGESVSSKIGELVVPYTPLTLYFFYISAIYVKKSDQGNGIGSALIQKVKFDYPSTKFTVMTESNNEKAIDFYLSTNWKVEARCHNSLLLTLDV